MKRIFYLYREIMPYNIPVLRELTHMGFEIKVFHKIKNRKTPYVPPSIENVEFIDEAELDIDGLIKYALRFNPDLVFICDWSIHKYNSCGVVLRKKLNIPVIVGCDTQWRAGKQWLNVISSKFRHHRYFSHILVAGVRQFEYAKKLGFRNDQILMNLLSADINKFQNLDISIDRFNGKRNFLFVGRFVEAKGMRILLNAWKSIDNKKGSELTLIGEGALKKELNFPGDVNVLPFMNQDELLSYVKKSCCFILPSTFEPWALVIHEFAAAGLPLIVTNACGAAPHFVINKYNGCVIPPSSPTDLKEAIEFIIKAGDEELFLYANRSRNLSNSITPEIVANSIISVL